MVERVYFDTKDYYLLPEKYHFDHEYCFYLHDKLAKIIAEGEKLGVFKQTIKTKRNLSKIKKGKIIDWLKKKGFQKQAKKFMIKQIFVATLSDALHFIHTALTCSDKGKLSVTYATLRKPLKDNLFILELLNTSKRDFFKRFENPPALLDIGGSFSPNDKKDIIKKNCQKIGFPPELSDLIYELRYLKSSRFGLEPLFERANHIVTSMKSFETESGNLNWVFSDEDSHKSQWYHLYHTLPFLLRYFVDTGYSILNSGITKKIKDELTLLDLLYFRKNYPKVLKELPHKTFCGKCHKIEKISKKKLDFCEKTNLYLCSCGEIDSIFNIKLVS